MKIILVRHGETDDNTSERMSGWTDTELSLKGIRQAHLLAQRIKGMPVHRILSSDLKRAVKTAEIIGQHQPDELFHEKLMGLREMHFGKLEQFTMKEIETLYPEEHDKIYHEGMAYAFPDGESLPSFHKRVMDTVDAYLKPAEADQTILIVAHSGTLRCILSHWIVGEPGGHWRFAVDHCSLTLINNVPDYPYIQTLNDTCHFDELEES